MYGFPGQSLSELEQDVEQIIRLGSEHLSLYTLTIEKNSRFYVQKVVLPQGQEQAEQYRSVCDWLEKAGFEQYEVSNFAKEGRQSKHNWNYWTGGDYIGLGIGAHSHLKGKRFWNVPRLTDYIDRLETNQPVVDGSEELASKDQFLETFLFGLRMNQGVDLGNLENRFQNRLDSARRDLVRNFVEEGLLDWKGDTVRTTPRGHLVLDEICARLILKRDRAKRGHPAFLN
jgi:oxygen-independent coproporphyrinogen-3 oxidase